MGALRMLLRSGEELVMDEHLTVDALIDKKPRLQKLRALLKERFTRRGLDSGAAETAATGEIESFLLVALSELGDAYVDSKSAALNKLIEIHGKIQEQYRAVLHGRGEVKLDLEALHAKYQEMQGLFDELGKPATTVAEEAKKPRTEGAANELVAEATRLPEGTVAAAPEQRLAALQGRRGWSAIVDRIKGKLGMRANLRAGTVELRIENGLIVVTSTTKGKPSVTFREFDTLAEPYSKKPLSTRVMQAHHGCQNALMKQLFGKLGYDGDQAPTIWLRDSTGESPHGIITHAIQNPSQAARMETAGLSYGMIRDWAVSDLKAANAPDEAIRSYLAAMDDYFARNVEPKLIGNAARLKGTIKVY